jgi:hypothetical protein
LTRELSFESEGRKRREVRRREMVLEDQMTTLYRKGNLVK